MTTTDHALWQRTARAATRGMYRTLPRHVDADDVYAAALVGCWKGAPKYDPTKGRTLSTWLYGCARNAAIDWLRSYGTHQRCRASDVSLSDCRMPDGEPIDAPDPRQPEPWEGMSSAEECERVLRPLRRAKMRRRDRTICRRVWQDGWTATDAAKKAGVSKSWACGVVRQGREVMREARRQEVMP